MAILELIVTGELFGQLTVNRFHYIQSGTPAAVMPSFGLISAFGLIPGSGGDPQFPGSTPASAWQVCVVGVFKWVSAYARNLYTPTDFYELPYLTRPQGGAAGEAAAPFMAYGLRSSRVRTDIRRGSKRFAGVSEDDAGAGGVVGSSQLARLATLASRLSSPLTYDDEGNTLTYNLAILQFEEYTTPRGRKAYRKYASPTVQLEHSATGMDWAPETVVRSQTSRQYGRGA